MSHIYTAFDRTPFTYLIGWSDHNVWYYGLHWKKNCVPSDLWKTYFTSSKYVKKFRKQYGEPDHVEIRKIFNSVNQAIEWESDILRKLKVTQKPNKWLNRSDNKSIFNETNPMLGKKHDDSTKQKISQARKALQNSAEHKLRFKNARPIQVYWIGKTHSAETKAKMSLAAKQRKRKATVILTSQSLSKQGAEQKVLCLHHLVIVPATNSQLFSMNIRLECNTCCERHPWNW